MKVDIEKQIDRLTRMMGTDEGFYILALHSFVEYFLRYEKKYGETPSFPELTWRFREELLAKYGDGFIDGLYCLGRLGRQHSYTNKVRHAFERMDVEEANAATHLFLTFCRLAGIGSVPALGALQQNLDLWKERQSPLEKSAVIRHMQRELERLRSENSSLLEQKEHYDETRRQLHRTQRELEDYTEQIQEREKISARRDEKLDTLRAERRGLIEERNVLLERLEGFDKLETYLCYLGRLSIYTRTRMDYEHTISRLTPEQEEAVGAVKLRGHFLIRGGAGTGKSLVLLESLRRAAQQSELQFAEGEQAVLVTFTRTLAKYNRYISALRAMKIPLDVIDTIDSIFYARLRRFTPDLQYDFEFLKKYLDGLELPDFISAEELAAEIEEYIFALDLKASEYIGGKVSRRGMRRTLTEAQRREIWKIAVEAAREMRGKKIYTKNYGRLVLLRKLEAAESAGAGSKLPDADDTDAIAGDSQSGDGLSGGGASGGSLNTYDVQGDNHNTDGLEEDTLNENAGAAPKIRYLFLDEVQDLTPVALRALRKLTTGPMIMAGDMGQSLYVYYSPFFRSGIDLRGSTRVLRTNFRNTRQIHELASRFRASVSRSADGEPANPAVFRDGPLPELYAAKSEEELLRQLCGKTRLFLEEMGYDPENLCVLVPRRSEIDTIIATFEEEGLPSEDIRREEFSFANRRKVRVSTLHSSKGLDFPVVMMYLPYLHRRCYYNPEETEKLLRNLIFVGLTRAMDNVNVFMTEKDDPILQDLRKAFVISR